jgi:hypothetical protein
VELYEKREDMDFEKKEYYKKDRIGYLRKEERERGKS